MNKLTGFLAVSLLSFTAMAFGQQNTNQKGEGHGTAQDIKTIPLQTNQPKSGVGTDSKSYIPYVGYVSNFWVDVGSSNYNEYTFTTYGLNFYTNYPSNVHCQTRQRDNYDFGYPDAFSCQVISTDYDRVVVRIKRLDAPYGWGQDLRLDFVVYESANY